MKTRKWVLLLAILICGIAMSADMPAPRHNIEIQREITYATLNGTPLKLDLYQPATHTEPAPVVLAIHGGSWMAGNRQSVRPLAECIAGEGCAVVAIDYRLAPMTTYPGQLEDARAAARWVRDNAAAYHFDLDRFTALGFSAGGQLASLLGVLPDAKTPRVTGVAAIAGPSDLTIPSPNLTAKMVMKTYLGASREDRPDLYAQASPVTHVTPDDPPFFLVHGTKDDVVPYNQSARMAEALKHAGVPVTFVTLKDAGHALPVESTAVGNEALAKMVAFLASSRRVQPQ